MQSDPVRTPTLQNKVDVPPELIAGRVALAPWGELFEATYQRADGDPGRVPWANGRACPALVEWLNREAPSIVRPGCRAVVVGCGLGDDVAELVRRGYDALGFDVAPTAVRWASRRHPACADRFVSADLLDPPVRMAGRFDLVVEAYTLQSLEPAHQAAAARGLARLVAPRGAVLVICRGRPESEPLSLEDGPPYALAGTELVRLLADSGLSLRDGPREFRCVHDPDHLCLRATFIKA